MSEDQKKENNDDSKVSIEKNMDEANDDLQFYLITLEDNNGNFHQIKIFKNSDAEEIAYNFCKENDLEYTFMKSIEKNIRKIIEQFDTPNKKVFYLDKSNSSITEVDEENLISENNFKSEKSSTNGRNFVSSKKTNYNIEIENKEKEINDSNSKKRNIVTNLNISTKQNLINEEYKNIINKENKNFEENKRLQAHININININSKDKKHIKNITTLYSIQENETNKKEVLSNSTKRRSNTNCILNIFKTNPTPNKNEKNFIKDQNNNINEKSDSKNKIPKNKNTKNNETSSTYKTINDNNKINSIDINSSLQNLNLDKSNNSKNIKTISDNININKTVNFPLKINELYKRAINIMNKAIKKQKKNIIKKTDINANSERKYRIIPECKIDKSSIIDNTSIQNSYFNLIKMYRNKSGKFNRKINNTLSLNVSRSTQNNNRKNNSLIENKFSTVKNKKNKIEININWNKNKNYKLYEKLFVLNKSYDRRNIFFNKSKNHISRNNNSNSKKIFYKKLNNTLSTNKNYFTNLSLNNTNYMNLNMSSKIYSPGDKNSSNNNNSDYFYKKFHNPKNIQHKRNIFNHRVINNITNHTINNTNTINYIINNSINNSNDTPNDSSHTKSSTDTSKLNNTLTIEVMNKIFLYFDKDKDNIITINNYKNMYKDIFTSLSLTSKKILSNMFDSLIELSKNNSNNKKLTINRNEFVDKMMFIYNKCLSKCDKIKFLFIQKDLNKSMNENNKCIMSYNIKPNLFNNKIKNKNPYLKNNSIVFKNMKNNSKKTGKKRK